MTDYDRGWWTGFWVAAASATIGVLVGASSARAEDIWTRIDNPMCSGERIEASSYSLLPRIQSAGYEDGSIFFSNHHYYAAPLYTDGKCKKLEDGRLQCKLDCTQKELRELATSLLANPGYDVRELRSLEQTCGQTKYFNLEK